ncbi:MAG TPA: 6-phosphogluconolactonase [Thermodesulfobacteriota bacterium]|nr:6-phosphogluconolactonase [Thermodesulfobacteriota bacterium]
MSDKAEIQVLSNLQELTRRAAEEFVSQAAEAVQAKGLFTVALSGGSTPKGLYSLLADGNEGFRARVAWDKIHFFWGDERHVPPDHPESNYRMAYEALLSKVPVPPDNVHRIKAENPNAADAAKDYEEILHGFFKLGQGQKPRFDLVLLGMGPEGHTASLFPGSEAIHEESRLVAAPWVGKFKTYRITLTPPVFNNARYILFLVSGEEKAETLRSVLQGEYRPDQFPAQVIQPMNGNLVWLVDREAARFLEPDME